jgi:glycosyltransferase involved in cell wall biosynthesis
MKVLHLAQPTEGGVARVVAELAAAHIASGVHTVVGCPEGGDLPREAAAAGAQIEVWSAVRELGAHVAGEVQQVRRLVRRVRPDVVHAHSAKAGLAARLAVRGAIPTVFQPHAWSFEAVEGRTARLARSWERWAAAHWTQRVLCVSRAERRRGEQAGIAAHWEVVPNGVPEVPDLGARERAAARVGLGVSAEARLVVCVGRLCPQKGQRLLLDAWPTVTAALPGARLVLVGDGPDRSALRQFAPQQVQFTGPCTAEEVQRWYAAADLVVLPSRWEGMALTPLEAMACGRPVVMTDVGGAHECLPPGQRELCLVPSGSPRALAEAMTRLLRDAELREVLGEAARKHVRTEFDVRKSTAAVLGVYGELLGVGPDLDAESDPGGGRGTGRVSGRGSNQGSEQGPAQGPEEAGDSDDSRDAAEADRHGLGRAAR